MTVSTSGGRVQVGPHMKKFEKVSSDDHLMSVAGGRNRHPGPMFVWGGG